MTRKEKIMMELCTFAGFICTLVRGVFNDRSYTSEDVLPWIVDYGTCFVGISMFFFCLLYGWQWLGNSIWDIKRALKKFSDNMS